MLSPMQYMYPYMKQKGYQDVASTTCLDGKFVFCKKSQMIVIERKRKVLFCSCDKVPAFKYNDKILEWSARISILE